VRVPVLPERVLRARVLPPAARVLPELQRALPEQEPVPEHSDCMQPAKSWSRAQQELLETSFL